MLFAVCIVYPVQVVVAEHATSRSQASAAARGEECSFLIRVERSVVEPPPQRVETRGAVDRMILGTRAIGASQTAGAMRVSLDEQNVEPALHLTFGGVTYTWTTGRNGPAIIRSRTATGFTCSRKVVFTLDRGFIAHPTSVSTATNVVIDDIGSDRRGLGGLLVRRIATRRMNDMYGEVRAVADRQTQDDIRREFETAVNQYLDGLNKQFKTVRQFATLAGKDAQLQMKVVGEGGDSVVFYIAGAKGNEEVELPQMAAAKAKAEVWIKNPTLPSGVSTLVAQQLPGIGSLMAVAPLMKIPAAGAEETIAYRREANWTVIGVNNAVAPLAQRPQTPLSRRLAVSSPEESRTAD